MNKSFDIDCECCLGLDRSQSLFYFVPQEKNFTVKLARLFWDCNDDYHSDHDDDHGGHDDDHGDHDVDDLTGGSRSAL